MTLTLLHGYPDCIGKRFSWCGYGNGPVAYSQVTGDPIVLPGFQHYIDNIAPAMTVSRNFFVFAVPNAVDFRAAWQLRWYAIGGGEVQAGTNLSAERIQLFGLGGVY
jgi:hypothetical protein